MKTYPDIVDLLCKSMVYPHATGLQLHSLFWQKAGARQFNQASDRPTLPEKSSCKFHTSSTSPSRRSTRCTCVAWKRPTLLHGQSQSNASAPGSKRCLLTVSATSIGIQNLSWPPVLANKNSSSILTQTFGSNPVALAVLRSRTMPTTTLPTCTLRLAMLLRKVLAENRLPRI